MHINPGRSVGCGSGSRCVDRSCIRPQHRVRCAPLATLLADVAAFSLCDERVADWGEFPSAQRDELVARLRAFMNRCPACGEAVVESDGVDRELPRLRCEGCEATLLGEGRE